MPRGADYYRPSYIARSGTASTDDTNTIRTSKTDTGIAPSGISQVSPLQGSEHGDASHARSQPRRMTAMGRHTPAIASLIDSGYCIRWLHTGACPFEHRRRGCKFLHKVPDEDVLNAIRAEEQSDWACMGHRQDLDGKQQQQQQSRDEPAEARKDDHLSGANASAVDNSEFSTVRMPMANDAKLNQQRRRQSVTNETDDHDSSPVNDFLPAGHGTHTKAPPLVTRANPNGPSDSGLRFSTERVKRRCLPLPEFATEGYRSEYADGEKGAPGREDEDDHNLRVPSIRRTTPMSLSLLPVPEKHPQKRLNSDGLDAKNVTETVLGATKEVGNEEPDFTENDLEMFLDHAKEIEAMQPKQVEEALKMLANEAPQHSASSWRRFYLEHVYPEYICRYGEHKRQDCDQASSPGVTRPSEAFQFFDESVHDAPVQRSPTSSDSTSLSEPHAGLEAVGPNDKRGTVDDLVADVLREMHHVKTKSSANAIAEESDAFEHGKDSNKNTSIPNDSNGANEQVMSNAATSQQQPADIASTESLAGASATNAGENLQSWQGDMDMALARKRKAEAMLAIANAEEDIIALRNSKVTSSLLAFRPRHC